MVAVEKQPIRYWSKVSSLWGEHLRECQAANFFEDSLPPASSPPTVVAQAS
jgi:hypothetical protein